MDDRRRARGVALGLGAILFVIGLSPRPDPHIAQLAVVLWLLARATFMRASRTADEAAPVANAA